MNSQIIKEELSQAKARVTIAVVALFFATGVFIFDTITLSVISFIGACAVFSTFWLLLLKQSPGDYIWRRRVISLFDISAVSFSLFVSGEWGSIFYFLYLWIIVGNGMRFGSQSLFEVMAMGVIGFSIILTVSPFWIQYTPLGMGLLLGLVVLPSFYIVLIRRLHDLNERLNIELTKSTYAATHDGMTKLHNREHFFDMVKTRVDAAKGCNDRFAIVFIDLDGFKQINDSYGHYYGDELLKTTASRILNVVRNNDLVARLGGDEFAILLDETDDKKINEFAKRLLFQIERNVTIENNESQITASVGISLFPEHGQLADSLVNAADTAMYRAKKNGKNRFIRLHVAPPQLSVG